MPHYALTDIARQLPDAWKSRVIARICAANLKLTRMDATSHVQETHDYAEGLLVVDGQLRLSVAGQPAAVHTGELYVVPAGVLHAIEAGSAGTLMIIDI